MNKKTKAVFLLTNKLFELYQALSVNKYMTADWQRNKERFQMRRHLSEQVQRSDLNLAPASDL